MSLGMWNRLAHNNKRGVHSRTYIVKVTMVKMIALLAYNIYEEFY